jgi:hypothetical protein
MLEPPVPAPEGLWLLVFPLAVLVGFYAIGRHAGLPPLFSVAVFGIGTAVVAVLAYRLHQSEQIPNCGASDAYPCLDAGNRFANTLAEAFLVVTEFGLAALAAGGLVYWWKERRTTAGEPATSVPQQESN